MLALNLNAHFITLMFITINYSSFCDEMNTNQAITVSSVEKTDGESNRATQDMLQGN